MSDARSENRWKRSGLRAYDGKWAVTYDSCLWWKLFSPQRMDQAVVEHVRRLTENPRVLDVGCATGRLLESLLQWGVDDVCGMDIAPRIVTAAQERLQPYDKSIDLRVGDAEEHIPWDDDTFDAVTLTGVFHHFTSPTSALKEIQRVLRPRGCLIVIDPRFFAPLRQVMNLFLRVYPLNGDFHFYTLKSAAALLKECQFEVVSRCQVTWNLFLVVCEKG
jgi:ubiquinone/menaquinone biosynthesis C-methylase UbiE